MLRRYPSIARRLPRRIFIDGRSASLDINTESSNKPSRKADVVMNASGTSAELSSDLSEAKIVAAKVVKLADEGRRIDHRSDTAMVKSSADGAQTFSGEQGQLQARP